MARAERGVDNAAHNDCGDGAHARPHTLHNDLPCHRPGVCQQHVAGHPPATIPRVGAEAVVGSRWLIWGEPSPGYPPPEWFWL